MFKDQQGCIAFEPHAFVTLVDKVIADQHRTLEFIFRNGMDSAFYLNCDQIEMEERAQGFYRTKQA